MIKATAMNCRPIRDQQTRQGNPFRLPGHTVAAERIRGGTGRIFTREEFDAE